LEPWDFVLNHPERLKSKSGEVIFINTLNVKREDVEELKYNWEEIAQAVDTLEINGDIEKSITKDKYLELAGKSIRLTRQGLNRYNSKFYLKDYLAERNARILNRSVIWTNRWMVVLTIIIALATALPLVCQKEEKVETKQPEYPIIKKG
jgi:hypothetical protein